MRKHLIKLMEERVGNNDDKQLPKMISQGCNKCHWSLYVDWYGQQIAMNKEFIRVAVYHQNYFWYLYIILLKMKRCCSWGDKFKWECSCKYSALHRRLSYFAKTNHEFQHAVFQLHCMSQEFNMRISLLKTKVMVFYSCCPAWI